MKYTRIVLAVLVGLAAAAPVSAQDPPPAAAPKPVLTDHQLLHKYVYATLGTEGVLLATLASGLDQWRDSPDEWGTDTTGYAKRWASEFAASAIGTPPSSRPVVYPMHVRGCRATFGPRLDLALPFPRAGWPSGLFARNAGGVGG